MKSTPLPILAGVLLSMAAGSASAQTTPGGMLFNPGTDLSLSSQNGHVGTVGGVFLTTYNLWPQVNWLGYYDKDGDGLANSHQVGLWDGNNTLVASVTVPSGTAAPLVNGYRWVALPSTLTLTYGSWYVIGAQTDGVDTWGDLLSVDNANLNWNAEYVVGDAGWGWSRAGRYDSTGSWPNPPSGQTSAGDSIYPAANLAYNLEIVPEPSSFALGGMGLLLLALRRRF